MDNAVSYITVICIMISPIFCCIAMCIGCCCKKPHQKVNPANGVTTTPQIVVDDDVSNPIKTDDPVEL